MTAPSAAAGAMITALAPVARRIVRRERVLMTRLLPIEGNRPPAAPPAPRRANPRVHSRHEAPPPFRRWRRVEEQRPKDLDCAFNSYNDGRCSTREDSSAGGLTC